MEPAVPQLRGPAQLIPGLPAVTCMPCTVQAWHSRAVTVSDHSLAVLWTRCQWNTWCERAPCLPRCSCRQWPTHCCCSSSPWPRPASTRPRRRQVLGTATFLKLFRTYLSMMHARMQDRGEYAAEPVYGKVLAGLHLVSRYAAMPLLDALLTWRKESLNVAARAPAEIIVLRKRVRRAGALAAACCSNAGGPVHGSTGWRQMRAISDTSVFEGACMGCACSWRWRRCSWKPRCSWWVPTAAR